MCGYLQVNPVVSKNIQRNRVSLSLKIVNELNSSSMIRIRQFGNNTCHGYLGTANIDLIKRFFCKSAKKVPHATKYYHSELCLLKISKSPAGSWKALFVSTSDIN
jgi:hypothetical protein